MMTVVPPPPSVSRCPLLVMAILTLKVSAASEVKVCGAPSRMMVLMASVPAFAVMPLLSVKGLPPMVYVPPVMVMELKVVKSAEIITSAYLRRASREHKVVASHRSYVVNPVGGSRPRSIRAAAVPCARRRAGLCPAAEKKQRDARCQQITTHRGFMKKSSLTHDCLNSKKKMSEVELASQDRLGLCASV